ncbi:MAG TPA: hypothetical protein VJU82_12100 [Acidobacteriaceae bacterium]|nr:hypothetical protein [Acidobacteriaceae bacterium]
MCGARRSYPQYLDLTLHAGDNARDAEGLQEKVNVIKTGLLRAGERLRELRGEAVTNTTPSPPEAAEGKND